MYLCINVTWLNSVKTFNLKKRGSVCEAVFALSNVRNILPSNIKHTIYNSLFCSFEEYAISEIKVLKWKN